MSEEKLGQEPAFAAVTGVEPNTHFQEGISKRFYAACAAMQGIIASGSTIEGKRNLGPDTIIPLAYDFADELLKQENE